MYAGAECWRWYARGVSGVAGHRAQMMPNVIAAHAPRPAVPHGPVRAAQGKGRRAVRQTAGSLRRRERGRTGPRPISVRASGARPAQGENGKRYRHHHPASQPWTGLPVLILKFPNNPILQSDAPPDCNYGATQAATGMCVHIVWWFESPLRVARSAAHPGQRCGRARGWFETP